jgi:hypothetical protein
VDSRLPAIPDQRVAASSGCPQAWRPAGFRQASAAFAYRALRNVCHAQSFWLDAGGLDHLRPLLSFLGYDLTEIGRRARKHRAAQVGKPRAELGIGEARIEAVNRLPNLTPRIASSANVTKAEAMQHCLMPR